MQLSTITQPEFCELTPAELEGVDGGGLSDFLHALVTAYQAYQTYQRYLAAHGIW